MTCDDEYKRFALGDLSGVPSKDTMCQIRTNNNQLCDKVFQANNDSGTTPPKIISMKEDSTKGKVIHVPFTRITQGEISSVTDTLFVDQSGILTFKNSSGIHEIRMGSTTIPVVSTLPSAPTVTTETRMVFLSSDGKVYVYSPTTSSWRALQYE